ncbi:hypothetical protein [Candidatus Nanohalobium constans]|uniref:Uncharacterized protein n=1 Tax=Candidatus Nanohalobium constans TaxID=2565781 RepID=A0A5Q0UF74_9ARCH|nr:hypothetical protein [Candidatus Nanohalobium constans]QGA80001.1 hypothetical protein LC1Nh_0093 [Candidatus Nanohalobium constans]
MAKDKFQQAMLIGIGLMVAIGFSGVFTYGNLVNTGGGNNNQDNQEIQAELPTQNYIDGNYNLSVQEQAYLSVNEEVVFVNVLYTDRRENYTELQGIPSKFNNTVYINSVNTSESTFATGTGAEPPTTLLIGNQPTRGSPYSIRSAETTQEDIISGICSSMRDVSQFGATCYT